MPFVTLKNTQPHLCNSQYSYTLLTPHPWFQPPLDHSRVQIPDPSDPVPVILYKLHVEAGNVILGSQH